MRDIFIEIWESVRRNKLRTSLTGLSVAWGILMIIVLLGAGNGLMNSFMKEASGVSTNTMQVGGGRTTKPYDGLKSGRWIELRDKDLDVTATNFADYIDDVAPEMSLNSDAKMYYDEYSVATSPTGILPASLDLNRIEILYGRALNDRDIRDKRKVAIVSTEDLKRLFISEDEMESVIGKYLRINQFPFQVVGIYKGSANNWRQSVYLPYTTFRTIYKKGQSIDNITFSFHGLESEEANEEFEKDYRATINLLHRADPDDTGAIWIWNRFVQNLQVEKAMGLLNKGLWIIGLFTLLSGIVGVSNIMLITVKERTHEFGIRKAIGAKPWDVTKLIISESVVITAVFGYVGMVLGLLVCEYLDVRFGHSATMVLGESIQVFKDPTVGMDVALEATLVLIVAGTLAGLVPAVKAAKVKPIEALRAD